MRLIIIDDYKLTKFNLPKKVQDYFLVPYKFKGESATKYLNIENSDGHWILRSNNEINALNNGLVMGTVKLEENAFYRLEVLPSKTPIFLYCTPLEEHFSNELDVQGKGTIKIGKNPSCDIVYNDNSTIDEHAVIEMGEGRAILRATNEKSPVYVNDFRAFNTTLKLGDVIFINGLKIIWMDKFIKVSENSQVSYGKLPKYVNTSLKLSTYNPIHLDLNEVQLYKPGDYFFHTPRLKTSVEKEIVRIDAPPSQNLSESLPLLLTLGSSLTIGASSLVMGYSIISGIQNGTRTVAGSLTQIVMCCAMIVGSLIIPRLTEQYRKMKQAQRERLRQKKYSEYLASKKQKIESIMTSQIQTLNENFLSPDKCYSLITSKNRKLWERKIKDEDFLTISFGMGTANAEIEIEAPEERFSLDDDNLLDDAIKLVGSSKILEGVPVTASLTKERAIAITGSKLEKTNYVDGIILELITFHSPEELKIIFVTDEAGDKRYNYMKYLPHLWSDDKTLRYYATNVEEAKAIMSKLEIEQKERANALSSSSDSEKDPLTKIKPKEEYKNFDSYYLIISDNYKSIRDIPLVQNILKSDLNLGFSLLLIENSMKDLPSECETFAYVADMESCLFSKSVNLSDQRRFAMYQIQNIDMDKVSAILSNIPIEIKSVEQMLPSSLTFLEMMKVSKIEQLNALTKWQENDPTRSLKTPIGVHKNGDVFYLDLHEKAHGPHGLIAGSTGSGKSEFIITFVLSLALNYSPKEVQFVLIDYKGGGLAGAFENREKGYKIPHLAGTITNLDTSAINRTLVSINSELKRRQQKFNEVRDRLGEGTIDIYKYQRLYRDGVIDEPISHLLIICDEFAELKSQRPEFMNELISTSRIGRSLGVHLILATQKPTGVVSDQIWANSKFKVCLKVQDRSDSMGMLKKPDAASIKEAGRFYLQVGYDELFDIGQSGWSGAKYVPSDVLRKKLDDSLNFLDNNGNIYKSINDTVYEENREALGDQLTNTVKYLIKIAEENGIKNEQLWLDNIPEVIYLQNLAAKYSYSAKSYEINPIIGEYDLPAKQKQGLLTLDLTNRGNTLIYGIPGSGKENLLYTIITGTSITHSPEEVNFYILDFGAETMKMFAGFPHVGDVSLLDDQEKIMNTFILLDEEMDKRKELFVDYAGSYTNYLAMSGKKLPLLVTVINSYEMFVENYNKLSEIIQPLIRDGGKYGIIFIVTTSTTNAIRARMAQNFKNVMSLQLPNDQDYRNLLGSPKELIPMRTFGRGIVKGEKEMVEFQSAFLCEKEKIIPTIKNIKDRLVENYKGVKARQVPVLPKNVKLEDLKEHVKSFDKMPIGVAEETKEICTYDFTKNTITSIVANNITDHMTFVTSMIKEFLMLNDVDVKIVDISNIINEKIKGMAIAKDRFDNALKELMNEINDSPKNRVTSVYVFTGIGEIKNHLNEEGIKIYNAIFSNVKKFLRTKIVLIDSYTSYKKIQIEPWYALAINTSDGIWLGEGIGVQLAFNYTSIKDDDRKASFDHLGFSISNGKPTLIKYVTDKDDKNEK